MSRIIGINEQNSDAQNSTYQKELRKIAFKTNVDMNRDVGMNPDTSTNQN